MHGKMNTDIVKRSACVLEHVIRGTIMIRGTISRSSDSNRGLLLAVPSSKGPVPCKP